VSRHRTWLVAETGSYGLFMKETLKVVPVPKHYAMKIYKGVEVNLHAFITSDIDRSE
jgi:hypothetical protein